MQATKRLERERLAIKLEAKTKEELEELAKHIEKAGYMTSIFFSL